VRPVAAVLKLHVVNIAGHRSDREEADVSLEGPRKGPYFRPEGC